ncbi:hypothetical protein Shyd_72100 [Streptomyces hydrogenans]|uniref:Uncharacterized protein n=1 Tax=Streptomyces hydrogenans TaxID=1873719 RepID=A0ABQ3PLD8_9ACTN|nr:hypothetical protein Shyd_72100 [Streptomyces hydrogenans]
MGTRSQEEPRSEGVVRVEREVRRAGAVGGAGDLGDEPVGGVASGDGTAGEDRAGDGLVGEDPALLQPTLVDEEGEPCGGARAARGAVDLAVGEDRDVPLARPFGVSGRSSWRITPYTPESSGPSGCQVAGWPASAVRISRPTRVSSGRDALSTARPSSRAETEA